jgi:hypothetical protein
MKKRTSLEKITIAGALLSFVISAAFIKFSGFSVASLVNLIATLMKMAIIGPASGTTDTMGMIYFIGGYFLNAFIAVLFLVLAFAFLASHGFYENHKKLGIALAALGGLIFFLFMGFTLASLLVSLAVLVSSYLIIPLASNYSKELKSWIHFRVGSNSIGRAHFAFNLVVTLAVFVAVLSNQAFYSASFTSEIKDSMALVIRGSMPAGVDPAAANALIEARLNEFISSPLISAYVKWLPVVAAFCVWALLEILRLFMPFIAGAFTSVIIKLENKCI